MTREQLQRVHEAAPPAFVEAYQNARVGPGNVDWVAIRWWASPAQDLLIGGSVLSREDWAHLRDDLNIAAVITAESEHTDLDVGVPGDLICDCATPDNGQPVVALFTRAIAFARRRAGDRLYVHCQMGGSRSPAFAYAILRSRGYKAAEILRWFRTVWGARVGGHDWGEHPYHRAYVVAAEAAVAAAR